MRALLLSAYDAGSHRYWRQALVEHFKAIDWTVLTLPPRHFSWRVRGNPLSWYAQQNQLLQHPYDLLIATSMVDVATLKGLIPNLAKLPTLVYFHENQFAYPDNIQQKPNIEAQMVSIYNALAADRIAFNSVYNQTTFIKGVKNLLTRLPDHAPLSVVADIEKKCQVLPVPIEPSYFMEKPTQPNAMLTLVWNHRWEYDKAPERLYAALKILKDKQVDFKLHLLGEQFRTIPPVFQQMQTQFAQHIINFGYVKKLADYQQILAASDVVISTSIHEFQGLSILKATAAGCIPVVPKRLCYPEYFPKDCLYDDFSDLNQEAFALAKHVEKLAIAHSCNNLPAAPKVSNMAWPSLHSNYQQLITELSQ